MWFEENFLLDERKESVGVFVLCVYVSLDESHIFIGIQIKLFYVILVFIV